MKPLNKSNLKPKSKINNFSWTLYLKSFLTNAVSKSRASVSQIKLKQTELLTMKSMVQSLSSQINQDVISKLST